MKRKDGALFFPSTVLPFENLLAAPESLGLVIPLFNYRNILFNKGIVYGEQLGEREAKEKGNIFHMEKKAHWLGNTE